MGIYLGIDVGRKRVGVALLTGKTGVAVPIGTFPRAQGNAERLIIKIIGERQVTDLVFGLPLTSDDREGNLVPDVRRFAKRITNRVAVAVHFTDEYGSSEEAREKLQHTSARQAKEHRDAMAAVIILEMFRASI